MSSRTVYGDGWPDTWWPTPEPPHRINQIYLEPILFEHAQAQPNIRIINRAQLADFRQGAHGATAVVEQLDAGEQARISARYLIGCDGAHSAVRHRIGAVLTGDPVLEHRQSTYIRAPKLCNAITTKLSWSNTSLNPRRSANMFATDER